MQPKKVAPLGGWRSPITPAMVAAVGLSSRGTMSAVQVAGGQVYWRQLRPDEDGRYDLLRLTNRSEAQSILPLPFSARSRVHEYGGGEYTVHEGVVYFCNDDDQRLYRMEPQAAPTPISPSPGRSRALRYADASMDDRRQRLVAVCERHLGEGWPVNELVSVPVDGQGPPRILASGHDFYASPRLDASGERLLFLTWDLPHMPWEGTELWVASIDGAGGLGEPRKIAGGQGESIFQPAWGPDGHLYFVSDRSQWWNLYRWDGQRIEPLAPVEAELGSPAWVFGMSRYDFLSSERIACVYTQDGVDRLGVIDIEARRLRPIDSPLSAFRPPHLAALDGSTIVFLASSPRETQALYRCDLQSGKISTLHQPVSASLDARYLSIPEAITFSSEGDRSAHAFLYPPRNDDFQPPPGELPPLLITLHGGPTGSASPQLHLETQFWTSRGFAVADLNYSGSSGYGRPYRERLTGRWGELDVLECVRLAQHLAERGRVDGQRLLIHGGSAGGFTTLAALTFYDAFAAGAAYYAVADVEALAQHTPKFEARYLDRLITTSAGGKDAFRARNPLRHIALLDRPLILFQGTEDALVPAEGARELVEALAQEGVPYAYLEFEGEGHGFQRPDTIERVLTGELYFYGRILGLPLADPIEPVEIHNLNL